MHTLDVLLLRTFYVQLESSSLLGHPVKTNAERNVKVLKRKVHIPITDLVGRPIIEKMTRLGVLKTAGHSYIFLKFDATLSNLHWSSETGWQ